MAREWCEGVEQVRSCWPVEPLPPERLPEVVAAQRDGWFLAPDAPLWAFLPAVWPTAHRRWIEDRSARYTTISCSGSDPVTLPWSAWDFFEVEREINDMLVDSGVPPRPAGLLWLLRPPHLFGRVEDVLTHLTDQAQAGDVPVMCCPSFVDLCEAEVLTLFG